MRCWRSSALWFTSGARSRLNAKSLTSSRGTILHSFGPENLVYFRDVYDHLIRIIEELDSLRDILSSVLEIHLAAASNQLNVTMKRLTAWGTIFVVITAIAGIYGMNFKFMPELEWRYGYFAVLGFMALISFGLFFYFKRRGDL
jgi:magnesium transporter